MARYIDVEKAVEEARLAYCKKCDSINGRMCIRCQFDDAMDLIEAAPTADVVPKSKGKWKPYKDHFTHRQVGWICTNCSSVISDVSNGDTDYCPHCGAAMETEEET